MLSWWGPMLSSLGKDCWPLVLEKAGCTWQMGLEKPNPTWAWKSPMPNWLGKAQQGHWLGKAFNERQCMMGLEKLKQQTGMDWAAVI